MSMNMKMNTGKNKSGSEKAGTGNAVTRGDADADTLALVEWICGPQGQALVEKTGYTPIHAQ